MNLKKHLKEGTYTYWVNKKSGTIHMVGTEYSKYWKNFKLTLSSTNLRYERMYFTRGSDMGAVDRFLKNYEFICDGAGIPMDFYHHVLRNRTLKNNFKYGVISKEEFFGRVFN